MVDDDFGSLEFADGVCGAGRDEEVGRGMEGEDGRGFWVVE